MTTQPINPTSLIRSITPTGGTALEAGTINVLIGPHNTGKSEVLRDLARLLGKLEPGSAERTASEEPHTKLIGDLTLVPKLTLDRLLAGLSVDGTGGDGTVAAGLGPDLKTPYRCSFGAELKSILYRPVITVRSVLTTALGAVMPLRVAYFSSEEMDQLVEPTPASSPLRIPENLLQAFQLQPGLAEPFDAAMVQLCDGRHVGLDATERVSLCLRIAQALPALTGQVTQDAKSFAALPRLDEQGDGWKACAAVVLTLLVCQGRIILLDEPDAFLQPDQARRLGQWIGEQATRLGTQLFIASRNPSFLTGLLTGGTDVTVFRLSRRDDVTRFDVVSPEVGRGLALFPLFAAQDALRCLFREGVVVVPDETDRIVYATVAERILRVRDVGFMHAHGARNLAFVVRLLRRANLPVCAVTELDLFQADAPFAELVKAATQEDTPQPWLATRDRLVSFVEGSFDETELSTSANEVESFLDQLKQGSPTPSVLPPSPRITPPSTASKWDRLRRGKLGVLPPELRVWVEELIDELKRVGVFVSPQGRLQGWMEENVAEDKEVWFNRTIQALDRGECPADLRGFVAEFTAYVRASRTTSRPTGARGSA